MKRILIISFFLFATAPLSSISGAVSAELNFLTVDGHGGLPLNVAAIGDAAAPGILFIHGMGMSYLSFEPQLQSDLAEKFRLVAFDLRGHGNSGKPWKPEDVQGSDIWADDVASVIDGMKLQKPIVVAWSMGGFVIADYVRKYGTANLGGINFVGTLAGLVAQPAPGGLVSPEVAKRNAALQTSGNIRENIQYNETNAALFEFPGMSTQYRADLRTMGMLVPPYFRKARTGRNLDHQDVTPQLKLPLLFTMGTLDSANYPVAYPNLKKALPKATYSEYEGVGHLPFAEDAKRFNRELAVFAAAVASPDKP